MNFDTNGQIVKIGKLNGESPIELQNIECGIYVISMSDKSKNKEYVTRFVKE